MTRRLASWLLGSAREALWAPVLVVVVHGTASLLFDAYDRFPPLDLPMHLAGGVAIALLLAVTVRRGVENGLLGQPSALARALLVLGLACTAALGWEGVEWLSDHVVGTHSQLGLDDTLSDVSMGALGALTFVVARSAVGKRSRRSGS